MILQILPKADIIGIDMQEERCQIAEKEFAIKTENNLQKALERGTLFVDVISRKAVRNLEIVGENVYLKWYGTPDGLENYDFAD